MKVFLRSSLLLAAALTALSGCVTPVSTVSRPDSYYDAGIAETSQVSLFAGDSSVLSDDAIASILAYPYQPPALSRIAVMPLGGDVWSSWSEELALTSEKMQRDVLQKLQASSKVYDASYLPSILVPQNRTVPYLREAAARYQADLLLVYRSYCQAFGKYRLFGADQSRAYCGVEAVLLDTRTGLVPFTTVANHSFDVVENDSDTNFRETQLRGQLNATATALAQVSEEIVRFLEPSM